jgi:hypothetical protein
MSAIPSGVNTCGHEADLPNSSRAGVASHYEHVRVLIVETGECGRDAAVKLVHIYTAREGALRVGFNEVHNAVLSRQINAIIGREVFR